jgi:cation/acetate symporter
VAGLGPPERDIGAARAPRWTGRALLLLFALTLLALSLLDRLGIPSVPVTESVTAAALVLFVLIACLSPARRPTDYYVADREIVPARGGLAGASGLAGILAAGLAGGIFETGAAVAITAAGLLLGFALLALLVAPRLRRFGGYTVGDLMAARFGGGARLAWALAAFTSSFLLLVTVLTVAGPLVAVFLGVTLERGLLLAALVTVLAVLPGGMRSVTATQGIQYFLVAVGCLVPAGLLTADTLADPIAGLAAPGLSALLPDLSVGGPAVLAIGVPLLLIAAGAAALPQMVATAPSAPTSRQATASYLWAIILGLALVVMGLVFGRLALIATGAATLSTGEMLAADGPLFSTLPQVLAGLAMSAILAALLAAGQASLFAAATALSHDVWDETLDRHGPAGRRILVARLAVIAVGAAAAWVVARIPADAPALLGWALAFSAAGSLMPLVLGLWWRGCTGPAALGGMLAGFCVAAVVLLIDVLSPATAGIGSTVAALVGTAASFGAAILLSLAIPNRDKSTDDIILALRSRGERPPLRERSA